MREKHQQVERDTNDVVVIPEKNSAEVEEINTAEVKVVDLNRQNRRFWENVKLWEATYIRSEMHKNQKSTPAQRKQY